jgi:conjugation transfer TcpE-like protein
MARDRLLIRSYRRVFEVDRRIYRIDRWALPVPGGVPLRAVGYFAATLLLAIALSVLPATRELIGAISAPLRYVVIPLAVAVLGSQAAPDGRAAHRFAADWVGFRLRSRRRSAGRVMPLEGEPVLWHGDLGVTWDQHGTRLARGRVTGPARITFNVPFRMRGLVVRSAADGPRGDAVVLCPGERLEVRP